MDKMKRMMGRAQNAASKAMDRLDRVQGVASDPNERIYDGLQQNDFVGLVQKFGAGPVADYIQAMEIKRLHRK
jgi:hypothetical protein